MKYAATARFGLFERARTSRRRAFVTWLYPPLLSVPRCARGGQLLVSHAKAVGIRSRQSGRTPDKALSARRPVSVWRCHMKPFSVSIGMFTLRKLAPLYRVAVRAFIVRRGCAPSALAWQPVFLTGGPGEGSRRSAARWSGYTLASCSGRAASTPKADLSQSICDAATGREPSGDLFASVVLAEVVMKCQLRRPVAAHFSSFPPMRMRADAYLNPPVHRTWPMIVICPGAASTSGYNRLSG